MRFAKQVLLGAGLLGLLSMSLTGCGKSVAKVNGEKISRQEYLDRLEAMPITVGEQARPAGAVVMEQLVQEKLRLEMAKKEGVAPTEDEINTRLDRLKREGSLAVLKKQGNTDEQIRQSILLQLSIFNLMTKGIKVTDKEAQDYYNQNTKQFTVVAGASFGAIITKKKETIDMANDLIKVKKQQFGTVAMRYGDIPALRKSQGYIGFLPERLDLLPPGKRPGKVITDKILGMKDGEVSEPIWGGDGYYIIKVYQHRRGEVKSFPSVRDQIKDTLAMQRAEAKYDPKSASRTRAVSPNERFRKFFMDANVKINVRRYAGLWAQMKEQAKQEVDTQNSPAVAPKPTGKP